MTDTVACTADNVAAAAEPADDRGRHLVPLLVLGIAAALVSWWASHAVFPAYSWNRDEPVYLWHVATLRSGRLTVPDGGVPDFLYPWLSAHRGRVFFSQYTLGLPLLLLVADLLGSPALGLAFGAALFVTGAYAFTFTLGRDRAIAVTAGALLLVSPIVVVQGGVYLGYVFSAGLGLWFVAALVHGTRTGRAPVLVAAGVLLGYVVLTRPFDAVLWLVAAAGPLAIWHRRERARLLRAATWCAIGLAPFVAVTLWYNQRLTGRFSTFPVTAKDPLDTYGFGARRLMPGFDPEQYGIREAVKGTLKNGFYLLYFVVGGVAALPVALYGLWRARFQRSTVVVLALVVLFPVGYFFFWGTKVSAITSRLSGPIYFVPLYGPLCVLVATALVAVWRARAWLGIALTVVLVAVGAPIGIDRIRANHDISAAQEPWKDVARQLERIPQRSLVFVAQGKPYAMLLDPYAVNAPGMNGKVLYASDLLSRDVDLVLANRDRRPFRLDPSYRADELGPRETPNTPQLGLVALRVERQVGSFTLHAVVTNPTDSPVVTVRVTVDDRVVTRTLARQSRRGARHEIDWTVSTTATGTNGSVARNADGELTFAVGYGAFGVTTFPTAREIVNYRLRDGAFDVLLPGRLERLVDLGGGNLQWRPELKLPELVLTSGTG